MATIKFSEFDSGNISAVGALLVGLESGINKKFTASDLIAGLASESYVDNEVLTLQNQITNNANDIANIADTDSQTLSWDLATSALSISNGNTVDLSGLQVKIDANFSNISILQGQVVSLESNVSVNTGDISVLQGNVVSIEAELANIADTDNQTLSYDGATASLSISNGNSVLLQEVLDNAGNITVIQGQIADLQANGNIQLLSLDNSSNVLSISGGNTVDFTTVLAGGGIGSVTGGTNITTVPSGSDVTVNLDPDISVTSLSATNFVHTQFLTLNNINVNSSATEINYLDGSIPGTATVNNAVVLDANKDIQGINALTSININVTDVTSTGNIDAGNINVDDDILMGSGTGGSITGANSISAESLIATSNLNVAGFLVDGIIDDDTLATASATTLATSESIKAYVDAKPLSGVAIGPGLVTEPTAGDQGIGMGDGADAALQSIAIGLDADASVAFTTAIGKNSSATGNFGIAIGEGATAGLQSVALGLNADASQNYVTAIGWDAVATGPGATALGHECEATGAGAIAVGSDSTATSTASLAIGYKSDVQAPYGTSIGWQNDLSSAATYTVSIGNYVSNNTYTQPDAIKVCAGSTYQTQLEVRPDYLDISSDNFGIACNASVGFTFTDAINGNVTLTSLIGGGGGGGANIAVATASDGQDYLTTFDTSFFITADPTSTDTGYIAMGEAAPQTWGSGAYVLHGSGLGQSILTGKTITNKIGHNGPHLGMAAWNEIYLGTRYAALYTDSSYYATLSATSLGHVALAIDNVDKLVVDGATDKVIIETDLDVTGNIIPSANITYDLGSETNRWKDLWLSGNTIHLGDTSISADDGTLSIDGLDLENTYATTSSIVNTATEVYNSNGILPADPKGMAVADPNGAGGWYWSSPGPGASPIGLNSFQWRMFNNNGPQTYTVADIDYMYMVVDLYTVGQVYFNIYTGTGPIPTTFTSRFSFTLNGDFANTGRFLMWAKPPGSSTTVDDVEVYPFLERLELPYAAVASSGPLLTSEPIKSLNVQTRTSPALTAGEVEFNLKNVGYKVKGGYIQNFDMDIYNPFDQGVSTTDTPEFQGVTATTGTVRLASLTTTERDTTLTAVDGDMIYNTTDSKLQGYQAGIWINLDGS